ncbi:hypothetical protein ABIE61_000633 [Marinobacterium sp. MBR-111]|jgi:hypothetical protein
MQVHVGIGGSECGEAGDQQFLQGVELVGTMVDQASIHLLFQPEPLLEAGLLQAGRSIGIVFQQPGRTPTP